MWTATRHIFHYSDTWQLVINTSTTILAFLMVFLIQKHAQPGWENDASVRRHGSKSAHRSLPRPPRRWKRISTGTLGHAMALQAKISLPDFQDVQQKYISKHWTHACAFLCSKKETQVADTALIVLAFVLGSAASAAQEPLPSQASTAQQGEEAPIPAKLFVTNILKDQKPIFTFPFKAIHGNHWKAALGVMLVTGGLVTADPYIEPFFRERSGFDSYKTGPLRGRNTTMAVSLTPVAFYVAGLATHSRHAKNTGLLAAEALVDTQLLSFVGKQAVGRLTPSDIPPHGNYRDTWFKYKGGFTNKGSFPSGHTASAFAVATVIADRYPKHRWVTWVTYGTATVLSLSRLPTRAHFSSDIFIGAALGYSISHFVVLRHRE